MHFNHAIWAIFETQNTLYIHNTSIKKKSIKIMTNYTIQSGDNLIRIAKANNTTVQELARLNNISDPNKIMAGQIIKLVENTPVQQQVQPDTNEKLQSQLEATQKQLEQMQSQMNTQENGLDEIDILEYGFAGGLTGVATWKGAKYLAPYAKDFAETNYLRGLYAGDKIKANAQKVTRATKQTVKHVVKKAELEYAFGKNAVKQGTQKATNATINAGKQTGNAVKTLSRKSSKIMNFTKAGKFVGKRMPVVGLTLAAVETYQAGKEGGAKAAVKQGAKSASGLACGAAGAKLGAVIGTAICPGIGTAIGGAVGGIAGYIAGEDIASKIMSWFS